MDNGNEKKLIVKLVCVLMSFGLWLYVTNVENPTRKSDIKDVAVELINTDSLKSADLALAANQKFTVDVKVEGPANEIYSLDKEQFKLTADMGAYALKKGENTIPVRVVNYPQGISIRNDGVLAVKVKIDDLAEKEFKVESKVKVSYNKGYSQQSSSVNPSTVKVSGPAEEVDKVKKVALVGETSNVESDVKEEFDIQALDSEDNEIKTVELSETRGTLAIKIGKGKEVSIKTTYSGTLQEGLSIDSVELSKDKVNISGDIDKIDVTEFLELEPINLSNVTESKDFTLKIKVPQGITVTKGDEYITVKLKLKSTQSVTKVIDSIPITYIGNFNEDVYSYEKPTVASVTVSGAEKDLQNLTKDNIKLEANIGDLKEGEDNVIELKAVLVNTNINVPISSEPIIIKVSKK